MKNKKQTKKEWRKVFRRNLDKSLLIDIPLFIFILIGFIEILRYFVFNQWIIIFLIIWFLPLIKRNVERPFFKIINAIEIADAYIKQK